MNGAEIYLELLQKANSPVKGDVVANSYQDQIALYDWTWGLSLNEAEPDSARNASIDSKEFGISKAVDSASTAMMSLMNSGDVCEKATITMVQRTQQSVMLRLVMKKVRLMSMELALKSEDSEVEMTEDWTLQFDEIEVLHKGARQNLNVKGKVADTALQTTAFKLNVAAGSKFQPLPEKSDSLDSRDIERMIKDQLSKSKS
jgi:type VI secretion system secreted protein Hcp